MTSWICPECGRECSLAEKGCTACVRPATESAAQQPEDMAGLASLAAPSPPWPDLSPCPQGWNLQSLEILPARFPYPPALSIPRLPPILRFTTRMSATVSSQTLETIPPVIYAQSQRSLFPHWVISFVVVGVVSLAVASSVHRFMAPAPESSSNTALPPKFHRTHTALTPASPMPKPALDADSETEYPFARFVEVSGLRVVKQNDRSQVQYLVMNRSSTQLNDIGLRIAVRSESASPGAAPLFTLAAQVPRLAPNQAKEMRVDLDSKGRTPQIPDWVHLRTDVRVVIP